MTLQFVTTCTRDWFYDMFQKRQKQGTKSPGFIMILMLQDIELSAMQKRLNGSTGEYMELGFNKQAV